MIKLSEAIELIGDVQIDKNTILLLKGYRDNHLRDEIIRITESMIFGKIEVNFETTDVTFTSKHNTVDVEYSTFPSINHKLKKNDEDYLYDLTNSLYENLVNDCRGESEICLEMTLYGIHYNTEVLRDYYETVKEYLPKNFVLGEILEIILK